MIEKIKGRDHLVIKRDGRLQKYSPTKLKRAINWCTEDNEILTKQLFESLNLKLYNKIRIEKLWDEVIETAANLISDMYPIWDNVAKRAYLLKIYKESYNYNASIDSLKYQQVIDKGIQVNVYAKEILETFSEEEIAELGRYIDKDLDLNFTFIGLVSIMEKYAFNATKVKKLELPQHVYMRLAMYPFWQEDKDIRLKLIKQRYDDLSLFRYTEATPKMINSLTDNTQMASCVLMQVDDKSESINETNGNLGLFSKYGGGLACDVSALRSSGSSVGNKGGKSSGPTQFIKIFEATVGAYDQMGKRKGAAVITFPFWHMDVRDLIMLKDAGGSEDKRARGLQYSIKWYNILTKRIKSNGDITLFDPKEVPGLNETWGSEFEDLYLMYENKHGVRKQKIPARDLAFLISKVRSETGNLYIVFPDNINLQRIGEKPVFASNLCCEIFLPTKASKNFNKRLITEFDDDNYYTKTKQETGEIALCNLSSINLDKWVHLNEYEKTNLVSNLLRASDNMISNSYYPVPDGELSNKTRRPIGIGISNYANFLASNRLLYTDKEAMKLTHEVMEDLTYYVLKGSNGLAKIRGAYKHFKESKWAQGIVPMDLYKMKDDSEYNFPLKHDWDSLRSSIKEHGVRFSYHFAIAPTATSGLIINSTEGIEPTKKLFEMREGTYTLPRIVPNLKQNRMYYQNAFDISNNVINKLASIRQKFLDQGQSVNHYYKTTDSSYEIVSDIINAEEIGLKSLYYLTPLKAGDIEEACESCST